MPSRIKRLTVQVNGTDEELRDALINGICERTAIELRLQLVQQRYSDLLASCYREPIEFWLQSFESFGCWHLAEFLDVLGGLDFAHCQEEREFIIYDANRSHPFAIPSNFVFGDDGVFRLRR